jgi:hypothetical protein
LLTYESSLINSAVVTFSNMATCKAAAKLNGEILLGRPVRIDWKERLPNRKLEQALEVERQALEVERQAGEVAERELEVKRRELEVKRRELEVIRRELEV